MASSLKVVPIRFGPGVELKTALMKAVADHDLKAAFILTCVGSVTRATLRFAEKSDGSEKDVRQFNFFFTSNYRALPSQSYYCSASAVF